MKNFIKLKHYKSIDGAFLRNLSKDIYSKEYGIKMMGHTWYTSGYYQNRNHECSLRYNKEKNYWELEFKYDQI